MKAFLLFLFISSGYSLLAQTNLRGKVTDSSRHPLPLATVQLNRSNGNTTITTTTTDSLGSFTFSNVDSGSYVITVSFVGFGTVSTAIAINKKAIYKDSANADSASLSANDNLITIDNIVLQKATGTLAGVTVTSASPPVTQKADTIQYSANQYKVNPDATSEDLIKKLPGVTVGSDGTVTAQGDQVKKVLVDGKEYFGDDATATLRNLPAEIIDKIQVFDKLSDQAQFTGYDDGNSQRTINITTKGGLKNSQFGKVYAGYGTDDRYTAGGNINFFNGNRRIALIGLTNNINQQNFSQQDILGVLSSGSNNNGRGGNAGGRGGPGGGQNNFLSGTSNGINATNSIGINYTDVWAKNLTVTGSYFFNNSKNTTVQNTNRENLISADSSLFYKEARNSTNNNFNHRFNLRLEYKIDSANQLIFTPALSFQNNKSNSFTNGINSLEDSTILSDIVNNSRTTSTGHNFTANLLYRHAFHKRGRSISFGVTPGLSDNTSDTYQDIFNNDTTNNNNVDSLQLFRDRHSHTKSISGNIAYTEPLSKKATLQFNYSPSYQNSTSKQFTSNLDATTGKYNLLDTSLSNLFDNDFVKHNAGVGYRTGDRYNNFMIGLNYQYTDMKSRQTYPQLLTIHKTFSNLLPNLMFNKKLSKTINMRLMYRAATQTPSVTQLQNVYNNNNPLYVTTGNSDLKQSYNNTLSARLTYTNTAKQSSFFLNVFLQQNSSYITNATYTATRDSALTKTVILTNGSQLSKPVNLDGYWSYRTLATYSFPLKKLKTTLNLNGGFTYTQQPGLINNINNQSKNYGYTGGAVFASNISEYIDFTISYNAGYNKVKNTLQPQLNTTYYSGNAVASINLLSKNGWVFHTDLNNQLYTGLSSGFNQRYTLWNASAGKKFLKNQRGDLRLSVFDILKQNQSITRNVTESYIEDVQTNVLQRYFMLTFTYKVNNVRSNMAAKPVPEAPSRERSERDGKPPLPSGNEPPPGPPPGGAL